ncbi:uncharacterized protein SPPG_01094 [Spizellomyces punctatus DAOM BR117]|uniref:Uncharacterized protein n=1 Tax=Spizellomyces punctatus (strain DAOM BR117) TaxID=645134 RepID=A0A0L0HRE3_SPIPD|nr:uncharacterized protein SPPG_01094 [Spizellomyces punctatus DAOM BR117]KND03618.1 hypothetical protein SPPG_01094 [Spizellomyces punctatus DAOM BR117]|eukprot:XP_016611657.1 hypothetical protein SPPG_01094 [Spizellomyces punctatus DAOM BR117]
MFLEKQILDHLGHFIRSQGYTPNEQEATCIKVYDNSPIFYTFANFVVWGSMAYYTLDMRSLFPKSTPTPPKTVPAALSHPSRTPVPRWITLWGIAAITAGAFATTYYTSKVAARSCLQCFLDVDNKKSELYLATRKLLADHHPDAKKFFMQEKRKESL